MKKLINNINSNDTRDFIFLIIYGIIFLNLYTTFLSDIKYFRFFAPEFIFFYGFVGILIYGLCRKMTNYECILTYCLMLYMTIKEYIKLLRVGRYIDLELITVNEITIYIKIILLFSLLIILILMYFLEDKYSEIFLNFETYTLMLLSVIGLLVILNSNHMFILYVGVELQSLSIYILCCLNRYSIKSVEAGLKYFIFGSYASLTLLLGISFLFLTLGTLNYNDLNTIFNSSDFKDNLLVHFALINLLIGLFFKLAIAPFHWWLSDVFEGSPDFITFFLAIIPKLPMFYILYVFYTSFYVCFIFYSYILMVCGVLSIVIGTILAIYTVKIKKLLAYSSIVHMGYMLVALSLNINISIAVAFYYYLIYLFSTINLFSIYLLIKNTQILVSGNITDLSYLKNSNKFLALIAITSLLSLAGIPPFMGFYGKLLVFNVLINVGNYIICLIILILSIISCVYYIRLIRFLFFNDKSEEYIAFQRKKSVYLYIFINILFFINIIFLFGQETLLLFIIRLFS